MVAAKYDRAMLNYGKSVHNTLQCQVTVFCCSVFFSKLWKLVSPQHAANKFYYL